MEFLRNFIMTGIRDMIKRDVALYQTYQYASGWFSKGVLTQTDLEEISRLYEEKAQAEIPIEQTEPTEIVEPAVEEIPEEDKPVESTEESEG